MSNQQERLYTVFNDAIHSAKEMAKERAKRSITPVPEIVPEPKAEQVDMATNTEFYHKEIVVIRKHVGFDIEEG